MNKSDRIDAVVLDQEHLNSGQKFEVQPKKLLFFKMGRELREAVYRSGSLEGGE